MSDTSCRERCPYARYCHAVCSFSDKYPDECGNYYHIEDMLHDADDMKREQYQRIAEQYEIHVEEVHDYL